MNIEYLLKNVTGKEQASRSQYYGDYVLSCAINAAIDKLNDDEIKFIGESLNKLSVDTGRSINLIEKMFPYYFVDIIADLLIQRINAGHDNKQRCVLALASIIDYAKNCYLNCEYNLSIYDKSHNLMIQKNFVGYELVGRVLFGCNIMQEEWWEEYKRVLNAGYKLF